MYLTHQEKGLRQLLLIDQLSLWRNRLARSTVNRKVGGSSPPRDDFFGYLNKQKPTKANIAINLILLNVLRPPLCQLPKTGRFNVPGHIKTSVYFKSPPPPPPPVYFGLLWLITP